MSLEPALLAAIAATPDDDLPRLVYADWLDENGRPLRAEFIRLQIEIANKETLPRAALNVFSHLWKRQQEILDDHRDELLGPLATVSITQAEYRRGFLDDITLTARDYLTAGAAVAALVPQPTRVRVTHATLDLVTFVLRPRHELQPITDVSFPFGPRTEMQSVAEFNEIDNPGWIRGCSDWHRLQSLDLESARLGDDHLAVLFASPCFPALEDLDLSFNDLTDAGVVALLGTGVPQRLKRLVLGGNPIGDEGAVALADALGGSPVLKELNLRMTNIGTAGRAALLRALGSKVDLF